MKQHANSTSITRDPSPGEGSDMALERSDVGS